MKRYDAAVGYMEEFGGGNYVKYEEALEWQDRSARLTQTLIEQSQKLHDSIYLLEQIRDYGRLSGDDWIIEKLDLFLEEINK